MKKNWQNDIHDRMSDYEIQEPKGLWEDVSKKMAEMKGECQEPLPQPFFNKTWRTATRAVVAASIVLLLGYAVLNTIGNKEGNTLKFTGARTNKQTIRLAEHGNHKTDESSNLLAQNAQSNSCEFDANTTSCPHITTHSQHSANTASTEDASIGNHAEKNSEIEKRQTTDNQQPSNENSYKDKEKENYSKRENLFDGYVAYNGERTNHSHSTVPSRWSISTCAMGAVGASKTTTSIGEYTVTAGPEGADWADNPMLGINLFNKGKEVTTKYAHKLPVRIGMKLAYAVNSKLSIGSGLTYTRLSSDMREGSKENFYTGEQKLNYIGIPVDVKYNILSFKRISMYGVAGVLTEKCISGTTVKKYTINSTQKKTETLDIDSKPIQVSINLATGLQLNVLENVGIYAEPGISYYFDDNSHLQTIYKEKPFNFNLNIGVRYTIGK